MGGLLVVFGETVSNHYKFILSHRLLHLLFVENSFWSVISNSGSSYCKTTRTETCADTSDRQQIGSPLNVEYEMEEQ